MCGAQFGSGECSWLFSAVFSSRLCFTGQTVRNNADSLIYKFTIQAEATLKDVNRVYLCASEIERHKSFVFTVMCPTSTNSYFFITGKKQTGEGSESENICSTICT